MTSINAGTFFSHKLSLAWWRGSYTSFNDHFSKIVKFSSLKNYTNNFWPSVYYQFQNQLTINIKIRQILQNATMGMSKRQSLATCASSVAWMARFSPISPKYFLWNSWGTCYNHFQVNFQIKCHEIKTMFTKKLRKIHHSTCHSLNFKFFSIQHLLSENLHRNIIWQSWDDIKHS